MEALIIEAIAMLMIRIVKIMNMLMKKIIKV
jgi:hypothetical protein